MRLEDNEFGDVWASLLMKLYCRAQQGGLPQQVSPRGLRCTEMTNVNLVIHQARSNIFESEVRNLNYRFGVAEWLWIWFGRKDVDSIARYNSHIARFSDDGETFDGAYGPMIRPQWDYVLQKLIADHDSRQAVLQIYRQPSREGTKDVPCTLAIQFLIREDKLHTIVTMRSSDVWLGLPYDAFTFSMLGNTLSTQLGIEQGSLAFNLGSSHLYEANIQGACDMLTRGSVRCFSSPAVGVPPHWLERVLEHRVSLGMNDRVWGKYVRVLRSITRAAAFKELIT